MRVCFSSTQASCGVLETRQQLPCIAVEPGSPPPISRERALSTGHLGFFGSLSLLVVVPNPIWQPLSVWRLAHVRFDHRCSHATVAQCPVLLVSGVPGVLLCLGPAEQTPNSARARNIHYAAHGRHSWNLGWFLLSARLPSPRRRGDATDRLDSLDWLAGRTQEELGSRKSGNAVSS